MTKIVVPDWLIATVLYSIYCTVLPGTVARSEQAARARNRQMYQKMRAFADSTMPLIQSMRRSCVLMLIEPIRTVRTMRLECRWYLRTSVQQMPDLRWREHKLRLDLTPKAQVSHIFCSQTNKQTIMKSFMISTSLFLLLGAPKICLSFHLSLVQPKKPLSSHIDNSFLLRQQLKFRALPHGRLESKLNFQKGSIGDDDKKLDVPSVTPGKLSSEYHALYGSLCDLHECSEGRQSEKNE